MVAPNRIETLGPAEQVVQTLTTHADHCVHNRTGVISPAPGTPLGVCWDPAVWKLEGDNKVVYVLRRQGKGTQRVRAGLLVDGKVREGNRDVATWQPAGLFEAAVAWTYHQVANVWSLDNEFAAHLASWSWPREHRDLKVVLAAFMLVQTRSGEPVRGQDGTVEFYDDDFRDVGEAMCLLRGAQDISPKLLLRVGEVLALPAVAAINRELGFGRSAREAPLGRYAKVVTKWLRYREHNPKMLDGLVKAGFRTTVMALARRVGYKPETPAFFAALRWKQAQAKDGRRSIAIGVDVAAAESWHGWAESDICARIVETKPDWKRIVGLLPPEVGVTRAVVAAAVEAGSLSDADLVILTPTLEELGLLDVAEIKARWQVACDAAENQRAANVAKRVKRADVMEALQGSADKATAKAIAEVTRDLRVYVLVDISGSMEGAIEAAKRCLAKFLQGFPVERTHVAVFNTMGREVHIKAPTAAAVEHAFKSFAAAGGTDYAAGARLLAQHIPAEGEDSLVLFVGDEGDPGHERLAAAVGPLHPVAFGLLKLPGVDNGVVTRAAADLGIPCFPIDVAMFEDPYAVTRTLRNLIASTPVGAVATARKLRKSLVQEVLDTPLLVKPTWA
mgnify:CR=1 FL=1